MNLELMEKLSHIEAKDLNQRFLKLSEECGELAQEILIASKAIKNKLPGSDGINGEAVDVIIVALSIFYKNGGTSDELSRIFERKCQKWQEHI
jgi:NTP pyrophosphatase (non-canonical NTP hydrolase)